MRFLFCPLHPATRAVRAQLWLGFFFLGFFFLDFLGSQDDILNDGPAIMGAKESVQNIMSTRTYQNYIRSHRHIPAIFPGFALKYMLLRFLSAFARFIYAMYRGLDVNNTLNRMEIKT